MIDPEEYKTALKFVVTNQRGSISAIQRSLRIGYKRASDLLDEMVDKGVVSEPGMNGTREVLWTVADLPHDNTDFQQRVVDEKKQLDLKLGDLTKFINEDLIFTSLSKLEQNRLHRQSQIMAEYSDILEERISHF